MANRFGYWALGAAVVVAAGAAAFEVQGPSARGAVEASDPPATADAPSPAFSMNHGALPPGHPPIGTSAQSSLPPASSEPPAITWQKPAAWSEVANASSMRLATYRVPRASGDDADAEITVSRAGGSVDANIERWVGQFDQAGKDDRTVRTVHGLKVTVVEVGGTYVPGTMSSSAAPSRRSGSRLLGAVVETVRAARAAFDAMIAGVAPVR
jgi:hypothetical protein